MSSIEILKLQLAEAESQADAQTISKLHEDLAEAYFTDYQSRHEYTREHYEHLQRAREHNNSAFPQSQQGPEQKARLFGRHKRIETAYDDLLVKLEHDLVMQGPLLPPLVQMRLHDNLAGLYQKCFEFHVIDDKKALEYSDKVVHHLKVAICHSNAGTRQASILRSRLLGASWSRHANWGLEDDADEAEKQCRAVLLHEPYHADALITLTQVLTKICRYTGDTRTIDEAIDAGQSLLDYEIEHGRQEYVPHSLAIIALAVFWRVMSGGAADVLPTVHNGAYEPGLGVAIELLRAGLSAASANNTGLRATLSNNLAEILQEQFKRHEDAKDLQEAFTLIEPFLKETASPAWKFESQLVHAQTLLIRYEYHGTKADLVAAGDLLERLVRKYTSNQVAVRGVLLMNASLKLSMAWKHLFSFNARPANRTSAFRYAYIARTIARTIAKSWRCSIIELECWLHLADLYRLRNDMVSSHSDLQVAENLVDLCLSRSRGYNSGFFRRAVASKLQIRRSCGEEKDIQLMSRLIWEAFFHSPPRCIADCVDFAHQIAHVPSHWSRSSDQLNGYRRSVHHFRIVDKLMPTICTFRKVNLRFCLVAELSEIAYTTKSRNDYDTAISQVRTFIEDCKKFDYGRLGIGSHVDLVRLLYWKWWHYRDEIAAGEEALSILESSMDNMAATTAVRLDYTIKLRSLQKHLGKSLEEVSKTFDATMDLFEYALTGQVPADRIELIRTFNYLAEQAAANALDLGLTPVKALVFLETARGVLWDKYLEDPIPLEALRQKDPTLYQEITKMREEKATYRFIKLEGQVRDRFVYAQAYCGLLQKARGVIPSFLRPNSLVENAEVYLHSIPLVAVVSDAASMSRGLIIRGSSVTTVDLPNFSPGVGEQLYAAITKILKAMYSTLGLHPTFESAAKTPAFRQLTQAYKTTLAVLYEVIARPILDHMEWDGSMECSEGLGRIYWMASGWLALLPIHLAGYHDKKPEKNKLFTVHDRVASSYIPGIKALAYLRSKEREHNLQKQPDVPKALLVGIEKTPGIFTELPNAPREIEEVKTVLSTKFRAPAVEPTSSATRREMQDCSLAHFALHGRTNNTDPFESSICLVDWKTTPTPLTVDSIMNSKFAKCQLAFLSLCDAAAVTEMKLRNEGIHIAGAFHMAGVPRIVATWYPLLDRFTVDFAKHFYRALLDSNGHFEMENSARALHAAVSELRVSQSDPFVWGVYAHFGL